MDQQLCNRSPAESSFSTGSQEVYGVWISYKPLLTAVILATFTLPQSSLIILPELRYVLPASHNSMRVDTVATVQFSSLRNLSSNNPSSGQYLKTLHISIQ